VIAIDFAGHRTGNKLNWHCPIGANYNLSAPPAAPIGKRRLRFEICITYFSAVPNLLTCTLFVSFPGHETLLLPFLRYIAQLRSFQNKMDCLGIFYYSGRVCVLFLVSDFYDVAVPNCESAILHSRHFREVFYWKPKLQRWSLSRSKWNTSCPRPNYTLEYTHTHTHRPNHDNAQVMNWPLMQ